MSCAWCGCHGATMPIKVPVAGVVKRLVVHSFCARELVDWALFVGTRRRV